MSEEEKFLSQIMYRGTSMKDIHEYIKQLEEEYKDVTVTELITQIREMFVITLHKVEHNQIVDETEDWQLLKWVIKILKDETSKLQIAIESRHKE
jgi:ERCC4-related helicase